MRDLKLVSLSEDGSHLVLTHDGTGEQFALPIDDRVRSAVVSDRARIGQLPLEVESRLRPKEIQARVRAGESSEDIAAAAGVSLERVLRYAGPVLAEREHIAELARRCAVRRHGHEGPGAILHQMVESRLRSAGFAPDTLTWDAWRVGTGTWTVAAQYTAAGETRTALFDFDPASRIVVPADDRARVLTGEQSIDEIPPEFEDRTQDEREGGRRPQRARLAAVPNPDERTHHAVERSADREDTVDLSGVRRAYRLESDPRVPSLGPDELADLDHPDEHDSHVDSPDYPAERARTEDAPTEHTHTQHTRTGQARDERAAASAGGSSSEARPDAPRRSQRKRRSKRAVVPSWDEILFGAADSGRRD